MSLASQITALATRIGAEFKNTVPSVFPAYTFPGTLSTNVGGPKFPIIDASYTIVKVRITAGTAPTGASIIVDVNKNGSTIFSTQANRPTITATNVSGTSGTPNTTTLTDSDWLTVDVDQVGSTVAGANLVVVIVLKRTA